jgi:hypothetical protein
MQCARKASDRNDGPSKAPLSWGRFLSKQDIRSDASSIFDQNLQQDIRRDRR